jgi:hypothetical protein
MTIYGGRKTHRRRQPFVLPQCQGIAVSYEGSVIDENAMAGYIKTRAQKTSAMALDFYLIYDFFTK